MASRLDSGKDYPPPLYTLIMSIGGLCVLFLSGHVAKCVKQSIFLVLDVKLGRAQ